MEPSKLSAFEMATLESDTRLEEIENMGWQGYCFQDAIEQSVHAFNAQYVK